MPGLIVDRADLKTTRKLTALMRREVVGLPDMLVSTRDGRAQIRWTDGPTAQGTIRTWGPLVDTPWLPTTFTRLFAPATFAAVLLTLDDPEVPRNQLILAAQRHLDRRDLLTDPLPDDLRASGGVLAAMAGVPARALLGHGRTRWERQMDTTLMDVGRDAIDAVSM